ncbi:Uu.00g026940.m01.CDS01 [Anthostomella pinea]|uniref:ubiquitinyl hydrolase 1 n=1 Tax=Anthostomella pinea TaxID=933095 RepID=A0AAI8V8N0_9PEZI|nr:Uu.00g026940.m01.CDS01 [Anthostomella pinea]
MKALCHAITSFCVPDNLTKRTGVEEAFDILRSGVAQPWMPLGESPRSILKALEALAPRREYYPANIKRLQRVTWDPNLTHNIQHDSYESLVQSIVAKSNRLGRFSSVGTITDNMGVLSHLRLRGEAQRQLYERPTRDTSAQTLGDAVYIPRDRQASSKETNVYQIARLTFAQSPSLCMDVKLKSVLESYQVIAGFHPDAGLSIDRGPLIDRIEEPINEKLGDLVAFCRHAERQGPLLFRLGLLAFAPKPDMDLIRSLAAFAGLQELRDLQPPAYNSFLDFQSRGQPTIQDMQKLLVSAYPAFDPKHTRWGGRHNDAAKAHVAKCEEDANNLARHLLKQWPVAENKLSVSGCDTQIIDSALALESVQPERKRRLRNTALELYVDQAQTLLDSLRAPRDTSAPLVWKHKEPSFFSEKHERVIPSVSLDLVLKIGPVLESSLPGASPSDSHNMAAETSTNVTCVRPPKTVSSEATELRSILDRFKCSEDTLRQKYAEDLLQSLAAFEDLEQTLPQDQKLPIPTTGEFAQSIQRELLMMKHSLEQVSEALAVNDPRSEWLQLGSIWPCATPTAVLELLRSASSHKFGTGMKEALVHYGQSITALQRLLRIQDTLLRENYRVFQEELDNIGHKNWSPLEQTDWLLLEIHSNILIRPGQVEVARAIIAPALSENIVLQMNMG